MKEMGVKVAFQREEKKEKKKGIFVQLKFSVTRSSPALNFSSFEFISHGPRSDRNIIQHLVHLIPARHYYLWTRLNHHLFANDSINHRVR